MAGKRFGGVGPQARYNFYLFGLDPRYIEFPSSPKFFARPKQQIKACQDNPQKNNNKTDPDRDTKSIEKLVNILIHVKNN